MDNTGTTGFSYDALNRLTDKALPDATVACTGSVPAGLTFAYDGVGKLTNRVRLRRGQPADRAGRAGRHRELRKSDLGGRAVAATIPVPISDCYVRMIPL